MRVLCVKKKIVNNNWSLFIRFFYIDLVMLLNVLGIEVLCFNFVGRKILFMLYFVDVIFFYFYIYNYMLVVCIFYVFFFYDS